MQLPIDFISRLKDLLKDEYQEFENAISQEQSVSIRLNSAKAGNILKDEQPVSWCRNAYYLKERPNFTFDPAFHSGAYYVQEASSMFLDCVISQYVDKPVRYLDLCAAPGGKTTLAVSALPQGSLIVGNEIERKRCHILAENLTKWGSPYVMVMNNKAADYSGLTHYFDVILTDVPCSGEGMFRKDPQAITEWSVSNVVKCAERQKEILADIWDALRPGGLLIYSTCTYNIEENELMIEYLCDEFGAMALDVNTDPGWGIHKPLYGDKPCYRFMPHATRGEGLFMAVVRKPDSDDVVERDDLVRSLSKKSQKKDKKGAKKEVATVFPKELKSWVNDQTQFEFDCVNEAFYAYPREYYGEMKALAGALNCVLPGLALASVKGKDYIPEHSLALSTAINEELFSISEVSLDDAITYLRRESIVPTVDMPKGYVLITYKGYPLGWVKNMGNRTNNLYPQEWRIRSGYNPESYFEIV